MTFADGKRHGAGQNEEKMEEERNYFIVIKHDIDAFAFAQYPDQNGIIDYEHFCDLKRVCSHHVNLWEIVNLPFLPGVLMLVAEDGKLRNLPENHLASVLYGSILTGDYICGDVVLVHRDEFNPSEIRYFDRSEVDEIMNTVRVVNVEDNEN